MVPMLQQPHMFQLPPMSQLPLMFQQLHMFQPLHMSQQPCHHTATASTPATYHPIPMAGTTTTPHHQSMLGHTQPNLKS